ncbi:MAG: hypothetical protein Ct9H300mP15_06620 [Gemmatimonadota bacterium]|nr:MAG: hypothetical protein Ct9H300mP15_06620 [Gemmatimonadota bacterium]
MLHQEPWLLLKPGAPEHAATCGKFVQTVLWSNDHKSADKYRYPNHDQPVRVVGTVMEARTRWVTPAIVGTTKSKWCW